MSVSNHSISFDRKLTDKDVFFLTVQFIENVLEFAFTLGWRWEVEGMFPKIVLCYT